MPPLDLSPELADRLACLYDDIEIAYDRLAGLLQFSCDNCPDNCCDSYFMHYTYAEWAFLWQGVRRLPAETQSEVLARAEAYNAEAETASRQNRRPAMMCPLNDSGRCLIYANRLLICRLHGIPATMTRPDRKTLAFPGCFRCQERTASITVPQVLDRTPFFKRMVELENTLVGSRRHLLPKVKLTIAQMLTLEGQTGRR